MIMSIDIAENEESTYKVSDRLEVLITDGDAFLIGEDFTLTLKSKAQFTVLAPGSYQVVDHDEYESVTLDENEFQALMSLYDQKIILERY